MSPQGWVRYWKVGRAVAPLVAVIALVLGEWYLAIAFGLVTFASVGLVAYWQSKAEEAGTDPYQ